MFVRAGFFAILACISFLAFADSPSDTVTIPLKDIWAKDMPGTKDVRELEPQIYGDVIKNLSYDERAELQKKSLIPHFAVSTPQEPAEGFAVKGIGLDALKAADEVFYTKKTPQSTFSCDDEISILFFTYEVGGAFVHLKSVERHNNRIDVIYQYVPHLTRQVTQHFALIPVGKLSAGDYSVNFVDATEKQLNPNKVNKFICKSFTFSVVSK